MIKARKSLHMLLFIALATILVSCNGDDDPSDEKNKSFEVVNDFVINKQGEKLLATNNGLFKFDEETSEFIKLQSDVELNEVNNLLYADENLSSNFLLATNNGVVDYLAQSRLNMQNSELIDDEVYCLATDSDGRFYYATAEGISINDNNRWLVNLGRESQFADYKVTDIATTTNGFTYVTTNGHGIERFEVDVDGVSGATIFDNDWSSGLNTNIINTVFIDDTIQVYGTAEGVAFHYSEFTKWDWIAYTTADGLIDNNVISIVKDFEGDWWFGTEKGLSQMADDKWENFTKESAGFISDSVKHLAIDVDGLLWIASDAGLSRLKNKEWTNFIK